MKKSQDRDRRTAKGMLPLRAVAALSLLFLVPLSSAAPPRPKPAPVPSIQVPIVGRPAEFAEAVGSKFTLTTHADRTEMYVGQSLTYTVRVKAIGKFYHPPERPSLQDMPRFSERFKIARSAGTQPDRVHSDQKTWDFVYRLQPVSEAVERVPPLPFAYYRPNAKPEQRGHFFTTFGDEIELKIKPVVTPTVVQAKPITAPGWLFEIARGPAVLHDARPFTFPPPMTTTLVLLAPPLVGLLWYVLWRWLYPDAARQARIRRSRAAMQALTALAALKPRDELVQVEQVAAITARYLRQRFDLPAAEPTPAEVAGHLRGALPGGEKLAEQAADFFRACDAARFAPAGIESRHGPDHAIMGERSPLLASRFTNLTEMARQLIVSLEEKSWSRR